MNGVGNVTFPWAVNGYTNFNGGGVYGSVQSGGTIFAGTQGEYYGTHSAGAGARGITASTAGSTGFNAAGCGVSGDAVNAFGSYKFGVFGSAGTYTRTGGVMGYDYGVAIGALGYYANNGIDYSVYGFGLGYATGVGTGMLSEDFYQLHPDLDPLQQPNNNTGLGIYGGVVGGWIKGMVYGTIVSGDRFGMYVDGKTITNEPIIQLLDNSTERKTITYTPVSLDAEISYKGKSALTNGSGFIAYPATIDAILDKNSLVVNITPMGNSNGLYVEKIDASGIYIKENNNGSSTLSFSWNVTGTRLDVKANDVSAEIVNDKFDNYLESYMHNENDPSASSPIWWDGEKIRFDAIPMDVIMKMKTPGKSIDASRPQTKTTK